MSDNVEMISANDVEEAVFRGWEDGKSPQILAREFALPVMQVEQILDRMLPVFDAANQLRAFKRELRRLEDLSGEFFAIARRDKSYDSAHLVARLNERICAMRGFSVVNIRMDPLTVQAEAQPSRHERIVAALMRLKHGPDWQPNDGDGAAGELSSSDDTEPSR